MPRLAAIPFALLLAAGCTTGLKSKLCGAPGQPCCAEQLCDDGARCSPSAVCEACGAKDQACCPQDACQAGLTCQAHLCSEAITCPDPCTLGALRCTAMNGVEACQQGGVCPAWKSLVATCPTGTVCEGDDAGIANCADRCLTTCAPASMLCTVNGLTRCVQGAGEVCPSLQAAQDDPDAPACAGGAIAGTDVIWESPLPFRAPLISIQGELTGSYWLLDSYGNIVHDDLGSWLYELRAPTGGVPLAIASCGLGSRLYAVGQSGRAWKRNGVDQSWSIEATGTTSALRAAVCDSNLTVYAAGDSSKLFIRKSGVWSSVDTGIAGPYSGIGFLYSLGKAWLVGPAGKVTRCDGLDTGVISCHADNPPGVTADLLAAWGDENTGKVYVVGAGGKILERGAVWLDQSIAGVTTPFTTIHGLMSSGATPPIVVIGGVDGTVAMLQSSGRFQAFTPGAGAVGAVHAFDSTHLLVGTMDGLLLGASSNRPTTWLPRGGQGPITTRLTGITGTGQGRLFAVGELGARYRRENEAWVPDLSGVATTARLNDVTAPWAGELYAVGASGLVLARRFGTWNDDSPGLTTEPLWALAHDSSRLVAVGGAGTWLEKVGSTGAWTRLPQAALSGALFAVAVLTDARGAATEIAAGGTDCQVLSKKGATFTTAALPGCTSAITALTFTPSGELFVGDQDGFVYRRTAGGFQQEFLGLSGGESVLGLTWSGGAVWAFAPMGQLFRRTTGWQPWGERLTNQDLADGFNDPDLGLFLVGQGGLVWHKP